MADKSQSTLRTAPLKVLETRRWSFVPEGTAHTGGVPVGTSSLVAGDRKPNQLVAEGPSPRGSARRPRPCLSLPALALHLSTLSSAVSSCAIVAAAAPASPSSRPLS